MAANPSFFPAFNPRPPSPTQHALTSTLNDPTSAVLTVRVVKSFPYRTMKALVLKNVDLLEAGGVGKLRERCLKEIPTAPGFKPFRTCTDKLDTLKIYVGAHQNKVRPNSTMNLIINLDKDDTLILPNESESSLASFGIVNEHELSLFNMDEYKEFQKDPEIKWDA